VAGTALVRDPRARFDDPLGRRCEACPGEPAVPATRLVFARNFPDGYAVCARHGRDPAGRPIPGDWRTWPQLRGDPETLALARRSWAAGEHPAAQAHDWALTGKRAQTPQEEEPEA
jgi:hypothetical protein